MNTSLSFKMIYSLIASLLIFLLAACSSAPQKTQLAAPNSGFLPNYEILKPVAIKDPDVHLWRYRKNDIPPNSYQAVIVDPIMINHEPNQKLTPEVLASIKAELQKDILDSLHNRGFKVVNQPGPGIARLTVGITGADYANDGSLRPRDLTPVGLVTNVAGRATDLNSKFPAMILESKVVDSQSKDILNEGLITIKGESFRTGSGSIDSFVEMTKKSIRLALQN
jgi:hypothetical protein